MTPSGGRRVSATGTSPGQRDDRLALGGPSVPPSTPTATDQPIPIPAQRADVPRASDAEVAEYERLRRELPSTVGELLAWRVAATPDLEAFRSQRADRSWTTLTWRDVGEDVDELAAGLLTLGLRPQERVAIASSTRVEWLLADLAVMRAGAATTTVYPSSTPDDVELVLADSGSRVVFAEDAGMLATVCDHWPALPRLEAVVVIDPSGLGPDHPQAADRRVLTFDELRQRGRRRLADDPGAVRATSASVAPGDLATLVYTSGTTGRPKGVRLTQATWVYEGTTTASIGLLTADDLQYLWLPLSHVFGKVLLTTQLAVGFATVVCGDLDRLVENLAAVRPTFMAGAPRIFEKVHARVQTQLAAGGEAKARLAAWAVDVGAQVARERRAGREPAGLLAVRYGLAQRLVLSRIAGLFGGRVRYLVSGSAPLSPQIAEWFHAVGVPVLEGYGLTETAAASFLARPDDARIGTVGKPFPGTEVRLADDGEVLLRGPGVMTGYHGLPEETEQVLGPDGWLRTGDIGEVVEGALRITDRKKDLIKTSGGKYVAPQALEATFKAICPYASQFVVHGDGRRYVTALVTLDADAMVGWAERHQLAGAPYEQVVTSPGVREMVQGYVDELNRGLGRWETVKRFAVLPRDLTVEDGELTPSLKLRRRVVEQRYAAQLDALYAG
jgi:long-chain acyl-CoA synthetase